MTIAPELTPTEKKNKTPAKQKERVLNRSIRNNAYLVVVVRVNVQNFTKIKNDVLPAVADL